MLEPAWIAVLIAACCTAEAEERPVEIGAIRWRADFDEALAHAKESGRPALVLFQEIPGCATCAGFGREALSHPLLVEAAETEFVPILVHNNRPGRDAALLERFGEPAWNNPVVRFLDGGGEDVIPREAGGYSVDFLAERMAAALRAAGRPVPPYLALLAEEPAPPERARAVFAMHCFWDGEAALGAIDGVVATRPGFVDGREVVEVTFDSARTGAERLEAAASAACAVEPAPEGEFRAAGPEDQKRHLRASRYAALELSEAQQCRVNAALAKGEDPLRWLSPRQHAALPAN